MNILRFGLVAVALGGAVAAEGQSVVGSVASNGAAVPLAAIIAEDSIGAVGSTAMSGPDGRYRLPLPYAGTWRIEASYLGLEPALRVLVVEPNASVQSDFNMALSPVRLDGFLAEGDRHCPAYEWSEQIPAVWAAARKLFDYGSERPADPARFLLERQERGYAHYEHLFGDDAYRQARGDRAVEIDSFWVMGSQPIPSPPAAELIEQGFMVPLVPDTARTFLYDFFFPMPDVVLSDDFGETHCLRVHREDGQLGLGFAPKRGNGIALDVQGILWLPTGSDPKARLEFRHRPIPREDVLWELLYVRGTGTGLVETTLRDRVGGTIEFEHVPERGWVASRWTFRWPHMSLGRPLSFIYAPEIRSQLRQGRTVRDIDVSPNQVIRRAVWQLSHLSEIEVRVVTMQVTDPGRE